MVRVRYQLLDDPLILVQKDQYACTFVGYVRCFPTNKSFFT